ncbi:MAG: hypothetical protein HOP08_01000 [Cyclobacteriaceae bacterium]|nr:hypothetical protein [Cyclobacteriaceae bacterium]
MKSLRFSLIVISIFSISVLFTSCKKDEVAPGPGTLTLHFDNVAGDADLQMNTANTPYVNSKGEAFKITWLTYYISNVKVKRSDGTVFTDEIKSDGSAGYYLIDETDAESQDIVLKNVPAGDYTEVTFTVGVDASQVNQGAQTGALDPAKGLFWSWNTGYIFFAVEGVSPVSTQTDNVFQYHVGGYKEDASSSIAANNVKTLTLGFNGDSAPVKVGHEPEVHLIMDIKKFFNGPGVALTFATNASRHTPKACVDLAGNISKAFTVDHVHAN